MTHLEPWEKNSRKLASQIGHAGEVRCGRLAGTMGGGATASHSPGDGKVSARECALAVPGAGKVLSLQWQW